MFIGGEKVPVGVAMADPGIRDGTAERGGKRQETNEFPRSERKENGSDRD